MTKQGSYDSIINVYVVKQLLKCLPFKPVDIASESGITLNKLNLMLSGKVMLSKSEEIKLIDNLCLEYNEDEGEYLPSGPYVLFLNNINAMEYIYNIITDYDGCFFEVVPTSIKRDQELKYFIVKDYWVCGEISIIMSPIESKLTNKLISVLGNFDGEIKVLDKIYDQIVMYCRVPSKTPKVDAERISMLLYDYGCWWTKVNRY